MKWVMAVCLLSMTYLGGRTLAASRLAPDEWPSTVVTQVASSHKVVALTFDACEAGTRMPLDQSIIDVLLARRIPFTVFMGGRFARDNSAEVRALAALPFVSIQNHSWSHPKDMRALTDEQVRVEVTRAQQMLTQVTGYTPTLFRFPGGHADQRTVDLVRDMGLQVVHWRWPEGDPDPRMDADAMVARTLGRTRSGDILVFHINSRGWHTAEALPQIIDGLSARGFQWVLLDQALR